VQTIFYFRFVTAVKKGLESLDSELFDRAFGHLRRYMQLAIAGIIVILLMAGLNLWLQGQIPLDCRDYLLWTASQFTFPLLFFFAALLLLRFAKRTQKALRENDVWLLPQSFKSIRALYRFIGILTAIGMILFLVGMAFAIAVGRIPASIG
jgi:hypothetical protein